MELVAMDNVLILVVMVFTFLFMVLATLGLVIIAKLKSLEKIAHGTFSYIREVNLRINAEEQDEEE